MTFRIGLFIDGNAEGGKKAALDTAGAVRDLGKAGTEASRGTDKLAQSSDRAEAQVRGLSAAERASATSARQMATSHGLAAGQVGSLSAQFNDIGVMMAAGQNPLQLAIQQGTQITQVIGHMGAAGAVRALGTAFMSLLNPVSLVTIASIAGGAALVQWLASGKEEALSLDDALTDLKDTSDQLARTDGLVAGPRAAAAEYRQLLGIVHEVDRLERDRSATAMIRASGLPDAIARNIAANSVAAQIDGDPIAFDFMGLDHLSEANFLLERTRELMAASRDDQAKELDGMVEALQLRGIMTTEVKSFVAQLANQLGITERIVEQEERRAETAGGYLTSAQRHHAAMLQYQKTREMAAGAERDAARELLDALTRENVERQTVLRHGEASAQVARLRADAERAATQELIDASGATGWLRDALEDAADEAHRLAITDMSAPINSAAAAAQVLADRLGVSLDIARGVVAATGEVGDPAGDPTVAGFDGDDPRNPARKGVWTSGYGRVWTQNPDRKSGQGGGARAEADAVAELIEQLQTELELLQETDPVQQEMLRYRELLAAATDAERAQIETLIAARDTEKRAMEGSADAAEFLEDALFNALDSVLSQSGDVIDALEGIGTAARNAALEAALLGEGPLAQIIGAPAGGALGQVVSAGLELAGIKVPKFSGGGMNYGIGSGTSDENLAWLSNGEFTLNALASQKNRHLLELLNAGYEVPMLASGGYAAAPAFSGIPTGINFAPVFNFVDQTSGGVDIGVEEEAGSGGRTFRMVLSDQVGAALAQPGGGAQKTLRNQFGVRRQGALR